jgi:hypothetical protein
MMDAIAADNFHVEAAPVWAGENIVGCHDRNIQRQPFCFSPQRLLKSEGAPLSRLLRRFARG